VGWGRGASEAGRELSRAVWRENNTKNAPRASAQSSAQPLLPERIARMEDRDAEKVVVRRAAALKDAWAWTVSRRGGAGALMR